MPFSPAPTFAPLLDLDCRWRTQPCLGETDNGDGLFLEKDRSDGSSLLLLVDVMHHGPQAALLVHHLGGQLLPQTSAENLSPSPLLRLLHSWLLPVCVPGDEQKTFVCALALRVAGQGGLTASNAAQPPPRKKSAAGIDAWDVPGDAPLGAEWSQGAYDEGSLTIQPGEGLLGCTDGVTEAGDPQYNTLLGGFLNGDPGGAGLPGRLFDALQNHAGAGWPADDTTALWLERRGGRV